ETAISFAPQSYPSTSTAVPFELPQGSIFWRIPTQVAADLNYAYTHIELGCNWGFLPTFFYPKADIALIQEIQQLHRNRINNDALHQIFNLQDEFRNPYPTKTEEEVDANFRAVQSIPHTLTDLLSEIKSAYLTMTQSFFIKKNSAHVLVLLEIYEALQGMISQTPSVRTI